MTIQFIDTNGTIKYNYNRQKGEGTIFSYFGSDPLVTIFLFGISICLCSIGLGFGIALLRFCILTLYQLNMSSFYNRIVLSPPPPPPKSRRSDNPLHQSLQRISFHPMQSNTCSSITAEDYNDNKQQQQYNNTSSKTTEN